MRRFGCIGHPLSHSFSAELHTKLTGKPYELLDLSADELPAFFAARDFDGINVTVPYKQAVLPYLDDLSDRAKTIGAVNTVVRRGDRLFGENTDFDGLTDLLKTAGFSLTGKTVCLLGSGGTSKTADAVARAQGAKCVFRVSRTGRDGCLCYDEIPADECDYLINTTPCGMSPHTDESPIDLDRFPSLIGVVDVIYNPLRTRLIQDAQRRNLPAVGGLSMLVGQALGAARLFHRCDFPADSAESLTRFLQNKRANAVLIGMPGCGKTTVGRLLADCLNRPFRDTDALLQERLGVSAGDYLRTHGEAAFRQAERELVSSLADCQGYVIATGGGTVLNPASADLLKQNGRLILLDRPLSALPVTPDRPLSATPEALTALFRERMPRYRSLADFTVTDPASPEAAVATIKEIFV